MIGCQLLLADAINKATDVIGRTIAWLTAFMALVTVVVVVLRYAFDQGAILLQESVIYLHGIVVMLGIPYALKENAHVRVDLLYSRWSQRTQTLIDVCGHVLFLIPVSLFILLHTWDYVGASWRIREGSPEVGGIPGVFVLKSLLPLLAIMLILQGVAQLMGGISKLLRK